MYSCHLAIALYKERIFLYIRQAELSEAGTYMVVVQIVVQNAQGSPP